MYPRVIALFLFIFASGALQANDAAVEMPLRFDPASTFGEAVGLQAPQTFEIREQHVRVPTVDLTVHFRGRPADPPGPPSGPEGPDAAWCFVRFSSPVSLGGYLVEHGSVWDSTGRLLADVRQLAVVL